MEEQEALREVEAGWEAAFGEYAPRRADAIGRIARWEWASGERYDPRPFYFQRFPGRGRVLRTPPEGYDRSPIEYGFDRRDRVVLARHYSLLYPPIQAFTRYLPGRIERVTYKIVGGTAIPGKFERYVLDDGGAMLQYAAYWLSGYGPGPQYRGKLDPRSIRRLYSSTSGLFRQYERYRYRGDRIERIESYQSGFGPHPARDTYDVAYDERGRVARIARVGGTDGAIYQRRQPGESMQSLLKAAQDALLLAIPASVRRADLREPLYCLVLYYRAVERYFPPYLVPGFAASREDLLARGDWLQVWMPSADPGLEWPVSQIAEPAALEACARAEQAIGTAQAWDAGERALRSLARSLNRLDWSAIVPVTTDFVVYAFNYEDDFLPALRASASPEQLRAWRQRGMLG